MERKGCQFPSCTLGYGWILPFLSPFPIFIEHRLMSTVLRWLRTALSLEVITVPERETEQHLVGRTGRD